LGNVLLPCIFTFPNYQSVMPKKFIPSRDAREVILPVVDPQKCFTITEYSFESGLSRKGVYEKIQSGELPITFISGKLFIYTGDIPEEGSPPTSDATSEPGLDATENILSKQLGHFLPNPLIIPE
jgi:hypothetical protein